MKSQLAKILAPQIGRLQGEVEARIKKEIQSQVDKLKAKILAKTEKGMCMSAKELEAIIKIRNNLISIINSFQKRILKFQKIIEKLEPPIKVIAAVIKILKVLPIPSAIGLIGIPIGVLNVFGDTLRISSGFIESLKNDVINISNLIKGVTFTIESVKKTLGSLDILVLECMQGFSNPGDVNRLLDQMQKGEIVEDFSPEDITAESLENSKKSLNLIIDGQLITTTQSLSDLLDSKIDPESTSSAAFLDTLSEALKSTGQQITSPVTEGEEGVGGQQPQIDSIQEEEGVGGQQPQIDSIQKEDNLNTAAARLDNLLTLLKTSDTAGQETSSEGSYSYRAKNGSVYEISIIKEPVRGSSLLRKVAIAKDFRKVTVMRGYPSFSLSSRILQEEIEFRLDQLK